VPHNTYHNALHDVGFHPNYGVARMISNFRGSIDNPAFLLSTLRLHHLWWLRKTHYCWLVRPYTDGLCTR